MQEQGSYDSRKDTNEHIKNVNALIGEVILELANRAKKHDASKLVEPEKGVHDQIVPKLKDLTYGSDDYRASLREMGPALTHHYMVNRHHPEHFVDGIDGMSLLDLMEMLADWKAATLRHNDGSIAKSMEVNKSRFVISEQLCRILLNTVQDMGWEDKNEKS